MSSWIEGLMESWGALGVAFLMFLETIFPPIPSEVVLPMAGYLAARGELSPVLALIGGTLGALVGVTLWYFVGRWLGLERTKRFARKHGRLLTLTPGEIDNVDAWFDKYGGYAVLFGRLIPGIRTLISLPAGVAGMTLRRFLTLSAIGTLAWSAFLMGAGWMLGSKFDQVGSWMAPVSNAILIGAGAYYIYRVVTFRKDVERPGGR